MLSAYPKTTRPLATLPKRATVVVPSFAVLACAGLAAFSPNIQAKANSTMTMSGVGAFNPKIVGKWPAVLAAAGAGTFSPKLMGGYRATLTAAGVGAFSPVPSIKASAAFAAAGVGSVGGSLASKASAQFVATGISAFVGALYAQVSSTVTFAGNGGFSASDSPSSVASFDGYGSLAAVSYAFYADAEVSGPSEELRVTYAAMEDRVLVVEAEDRVYEATSGPLVATPPNRKRML